MSDGTEIYPARRNPLKIHETRCERRREGCQLKRHWVAESEAEVEAKATQAGWSQSAKLDSSGFEVAMSRGWQCPVCTFVPTQTKRDM